MGEGGFGPPKSVTTDLQSAPFGRSGIPPYGAGERSRTINLLILLTAAFTATVVFVSRTFS